MTIPYQPEQISDEELNEFLAALEPMRTELIPETVDNNWRKTLGLSDNFPTNAL